MANTDLKITELPALAGANLQAADLLPVADGSASETVKITAKDLVQYGLQLIDAGSIDPAKLQGGLTPGPDTITTLELANDAVKAENLDDNSTVVVQPALPGSGGYVGQLALATTENKLYVWNGSQWVALKAPGSINSVRGDAAGVAPTTVAQVGDDVVVSAALAPTTAAGQFLAGPQSAGGAVAPRAIVGSDLPAATSAQRGAVLVNGGGLRMTGNQLSIDNNVTASTNTHVVTYNAAGLVTGGRAIESADLPLATAALPGVVLPGTGLTVEPGGYLGHPNVLAPSTGAKVTWDASGHITGSSVLLESDIPSLSADKITGGNLSATVLSAGSITRDKLADYAITYIQEATPPAITGAQHIGTLWFQESTARLSMFNGNSWMPVGQGALSEENMRFCGLFDAAAGLVTALTPYGTSAALTVGGGIPTATNQLTGVYLAIDTAGTYDGKTYDVGDWIMCLGQARGWERLDLAAGGGGGGAATLDDLVDVTITTPSTGDVLAYNGTSWVNGGLPDPGTY